jgi:chorismate mutase
MNEQEMVLRLKALDEEISKMDSELSALKHKRDNVKRALIEYMEANAITRTAEYPGLGYAILPKPVLRASVAEENKPDLFEFLKGIGRDEAVKSTVHPSTLSSIIRERIEAGEPVPEYVKFYFQQNVLIHGG